MVELAESSAVEAHVMERVSTAFSRSAHSGPERPHTPHTLLHSKTFLVHLNA